MNVAFEVGQHPHVSARLGDTSKDKIEGALVHGG
jgi:hypothetical protein